MLDPYAFACRGRGIAMATMHCVEPGAAGAGRHDRDLLHGRLVYAAWATRIPAIKDDLGLSDGELGLAILGLEAGAIVGLPAGGALVARAGSRQALRAGFAIFPRAGRRRARAHARPPSLRRSR